MNRIRLLILALGITLLNTSGNAQTAERDSVAIISEIESSGNITVNLPPAIFKYLVGSAETNDNIDTEDQTATESTAKKNTHVGYRVLVFDDNNVHTAKHAAEARKRQVENRFPEFRVYVQFNSPYWRVKAGDFRTRSEADAAMAAIRAAFPSFGNQLRIVRDHINSH